MNYKKTEGQESISYQALLDENHALKDEIESMRKRLAESEAHKQLEEELREAYQNLQEQSEELQAANEELQVQSEELQVQSEELQNAYQALSKSEERYRMLFINMTEAFFIGEPIYDKDGRPCDYRFIEINPAFELYTGLKRKHILGKSVTEILPNASQLSIEKYGKVVLSGQSIHFEDFSQTLNKYFDIYVFSPEKGKFATIFRDVTERKKLEEQTRQRAEELETVMEVAPVAIWIGHDQQSHDITGNRMANEFYEAEVGENVSANVTPNRRFFYNDCELTADELPMQQASLKNIDVRNTEFDVLLQSGEWRTLLGSASPLHDAKGHVRGSVGTFIDITDRKRVEKALQKSEERYRMLFKNMTEGFALTEVIYDKAGRPSDYRYLEMNPAYERNLGVKREDLLGKTMLEVFPNTTPTTIEKFDEIVLNGQSTQYEVFSQEANRYIDTYAFIPEKGKLAWIFRDITARKEAEAKLKETLDNLDKLVRERTAELEKAYNSLKESEISLAEAQGIGHIGNWERNISTGRTFWSDEMYRIFGFKPQEKVPSYDLFLSLIHPDDRDYIDKSVKNTFNGKLYNVNFRIITADGEERIVHAKGEVVFNEKNNPILIKGVVQDITERKKAEEALAKIEQIRIKEIHHRIKNNLQVISSLLDLQADTFSNLDVCEVPEVLEAFNESKNRVISMALIHEELYKGKNIDTLDFAAYLKKLTEDLFNSYNLVHGNINLKLNLDQVYLNMDTAIPLGIMVNELVSNSLKHAFPTCREGQIQINLRKAQTCAIKNEHSNSDEDCIENNCFDYILEVSDNGRGISKDIDIESLNSLGLQLVNILVEQIDGRLEVKSDKGAEFTIWFNNIEI